MSKHNRKAVQQETTKFLSRNKFRSKATKYTDHKPDFNRRWPPFNSIIEVWSIDTLEAVCKLRKNYTKENIGFLVMANSTNQGGRWKQGTSGQEESVCRRTNLTQCFKGMKYPIPEFGSFHIKNIAIIRDTEKNGYKMFKKPVLCDCVLSAAYHDPPTDSNNRLCDGYREKTTAKIESILNAFIENGNHVVVLGAYGCGAFGNPVEDIAQIFSEVLFSKKYAGEFKHIVFAVLKDVGIKNYRAFDNVFH